MTDKERAAAVAKLDQIEANVTEQIGDMNKRGQAKLRRRLATMIQSSSGPMSVDLLIAKLAVIGWTKIDGIIDEIIESQIEDTK